MMHAFRPLVVLLATLVTTAQAGTCLPRFGDSQAAVESLSARLRDQCGCCPKHGRRRCATAVIRAAIQSDDIPRACAKVAKRGFASYCRENEQVSCVPTGGCFDNVGGACTGEPCRLGGADCPASSGLCSSGCRGGGVGEAGLQWWSTCGDPSCSTHRDHPGVPDCTATQTPGATCAPAGRTCDPGSDCNELLLCAKGDPTHGNRCPISRRAYKDDVRYLDDAERRRLYDELMDFRLATWRYKGMPADRRHLGFVIDDVEPTAAAEHDHVDLYGYTSMAVAALQTQARQIDALEREVAALRAELARRRDSPAQLRSQRSSISSRSPSAARRIAINVGSVPASSRMSSDATSNQ